MRSLLAAAVAGRTAGTRIVCLPGAFQTPEDFLTAGFDTKVRERGLAIDLLFVDVEMQDLTDRRAVAQLRNDVVLPAHRLGCRSIWFAGISLGGFIALTYGLTHPGDLAGICLLAPYPGNRMVTAEIAQAPGLAAWIPGELAEDDEERRVWRFVQDQPAGSRFLYLGFGCDDRFATAHRLMAQALPPQVVDVVAGGHDWPTWTTLWENFLDSTFA